MDRQTLTYTCTQALSHTADTYTHTHTQTNRHTHTCTHTLAHMHTHPRTQQTHIHTYTHSLSHCMHSLVVSQQVMWAVNHLRGRFLVTYRSFTHKEFAYIQQLLLVSIFQDQTVTGHWCMFWNIFINTNRYNNKLLVTMHCYCDSDSKIICLYVGYSDMFFWTMSLLCMMIYY